MKKKLNKLKLEKKSKLNLSEEASVGLWKSRDEMRNSRRWVRNLRKQEWDNYEIS